MSYVFEGLEPAKLWKNFYELNQIPRESKHEAKVAEWIVEFGKDKGMEVIQDDAGNVKINKPATKGYEDAPKVCIQGHMDMVCEKNEGVDHDFRNDPIKMKIEDGFVRAEGTSLGADNGIGVAAGLTLIESDDLVHPPLEFLFTVDEETGLTGAMELEEGFIEADILINCDSEEDGVFFIGCAGGKNTELKLKLKTKEPEADKTALSVKLKGFKGGHSGLDIDKGRANAIIQLNRLLWKLNQDLDLDLSMIKGGSAHNAIPREAASLIMVDSAKVDEVKKAADEFAQDLVSEYGDKEGKPEILVQEDNTPEKIFSDETKETVLNFIYGMPNGILSMSPDIEGLVQTSTNLATVETEDDMLKILSSQRSSVSSQKDEMAEKVKSVGLLAGAEVVHQGEYPGWQPNPDSPILKKMKEVYQDLYDVEPGQEAIHAGLETGLIGEKVPGIDMVSFGPTINNPHSPDEEVKIDTVERFWNVLKESLKKVAEDSK
ncbi:MAG TPA: aminoacyl-histidine dipeptidase [bacterium]|nr:aminoacyl-histidine dipeptidase [bacterium]